MTPTTIPPAAAMKKSIPTSTIVKVPDTARIAARSAVRAVASLTRLSPSSTLTIARGIPTRRATALAAIASGGATIAPSANPAASGRPGISQAATNPTTSVVKMTNPTERLINARRFARKSMNEVLYAAE